MENFGYNEKIKETLAHELDNIMDERRTVYDQVKQLELLKNDSDINEIKIDEFIKMIPKEQKKINEYNSTNNKNYQQLKKKDIIEENIKAFDKSSKFSIESSGKIEKCVRYDKKLGLDEEDIDDSNNSNSNQTSNNLADDGYFKDLIKIKFDS